MISRLLLLMLAALFFASCEEYDYHIRHNRNARFVYRMPQPGGYEK